VTLHVSQELAPNRTTVIKWSRQVVSRREEHEMIELAETASAGNTPRLYHHANLSKLSSRIRGDFSDIRYEDIRYEDRELRLLVQERVSYITELSASNLKKVTFDFIQSKFSI
jgi:hypothetical protein